MARLSAILTLIATLVAGSVAHADKGTALATGGAPARADVDSIAQVWQTWNNCGPASVVMALSTIGVDASQEEARLALRGEDIRRGMPSRNVDPWLRSKYGLRAIARTNGTQDQLKRFVASGIPVVVTQWLEDPPSRIAHYRIVRGYDDARGVFYVNDPVRGPNLALSYDWFEENWKVFAYRYLVVYRTADEARVKNLVGEDWDEATMRERLYERAGASALAQGRQSAWFGYGEAAYQYGKFAEAVGAFERGLALGPATGVFTLRVSYPMSLRLIGREAGAGAAFSRFASLGTAPVATPNTADPIALALFASRHPVLRAE